MKSNTLIIIFLILFIFLTIFFVLCNSFKKKGYTQSPNDFLKKLLNKVEQHLNPLKKLYSRMHKLSDSFLFSMLYIKSEIFYSLCQVNCLFGCSVHNVKYQYGLFVENTK